MKKRRIVITAFLLVACMLIGVGYAAITGSITINGKTSAGVHSDNFKVIIEQGTEVVKKNGATLTNPTGEGVTPYYSFTYGTLGTSVIANINEGVLTQEGDTVTITFTILNESESLHAKVSYKTLTHDNDEYFEVTTDFSGERTLGEKGSGTDSTTVTVTIQLLKTLAEGSKTCDAQLLLDTSAVEITTP